MTIAITINNLELIKELSSIDKVFNHLSNISDLVYIISVERNDINQNIHYHAMIESSYLPSSLPYDTKMWSKELVTEIDILQYIEYIKKDGKYKVFNRHQYEITNLKGWHIELMKVAPLYDDLASLLNNHPNLIKHVFKVSKYFEIIKGKEKKR